MMNLKQFAALPAFACRRIARFCCPTSTARAQSAPASGSSLRQRTAPSKPAADTGSKRRPRAKSYYHVALADIYEEEAVTSGQPEYVTHAIEEYKDALNADPDSAELNDALAELYFRTGHVHDAEATARALLKTVARRH